jgi:hypothetical protein
MNTKFRIFRTVLLSVGLTLSLLSCSDSANGTDETSSLPQGEQSFEKNAQVYWQDGTPFTGDLDVLFNGTVLSKVQAGKYTLAFPTDEQIATILANAPSLKEICPTVTGSDSANITCDIEVSSQTAKSLSFEPEVNLLAPSGKNVRLHYRTDFSEVNGANGVIYSYAPEMVTYHYTPEAVTVKGSITMIAGAPFIAAVYDIQLKKGWTRVLTYYEGNGANMKTYSTTDLSKMEGKNLKWTLESSP